jgi:hypothetical protein
LRDMLTRNFMDFRVSLLIFMGEFLADCKNVAKWKVNDSMGRIRGKCKRSCHLALYPASSLEDSSYCYICMCLQ